MIPVEGKDSRSKFFWSGNSTGTGGVGVLLAEQWWEKVFEVKRVTDRILLLRMVVGKVVFAFICVYAPQAGHSAEEKDRFYEQLQAVAAEVPAAEELFICGDWNGHIGQARSGYEEVHGGHALGKRNIEGERILEFVIANDLEMCSRKVKDTSSHINQGAPQRRLTTSCTFAASESM